MNHAGELVSAYLDGELNLDERQRLFQHLSSCGQCSAELESMQSVRTAVRSLPMMELPPGLVPEADPEPVPLRRNRGFLVGAAAALVAAIVAISAILTPPPDSISVEELNSRFGARVSIDPAFGPAKVVVPEITEISE